MQPKALESRPKLEGSLATQYSVYADVARGRRYSEGHPLALGPVELLAYVQLHRVHSSEVESVTDAVDIFDRAWLEAQSVLNEAKKPISSVPTA